MYYKRHLVLFTLIFGLLFFVISLHTALSQEDNVSFYIPVNTEMFSKKAEITVEIFNAKQMAALERNNSCTTSYNAQTNEEEISCPQGITYEKVDPEKFTFAVAQISEGIKVVTKTVNEGEGYRIMVSGLSNDDCNTASGGVTGVADSRNITIGEFPWAVTARGCIEQ